jgi:hypothetical protein
MTLRPLALTVIFAFAASSTAWAQAQLSSTASTGPAMETLSLGGGRSLTTRGLASGLKLGEGTVLHAGLFADVGYDTNVLYTNGTSNSSTPSAVLHVIPRLEITNAEKDGSVPSGTYYDLVASVDVRKYLSDSRDVTDQDAINPTLGGTAEFSSGQALTLSLSESFTRYQQAPYQAGDPIVADNNLASVSATLAPGGGRLRVMLRYTNLINKYEGTTYDQGSYMGNEGVLDVGWRWLPKTSLYLKVAAGAITSLAESPNNHASYPLRTLLGIRGLLTEKLGVNIGAGYSNAFYSGASSPSGFGNVGIVTEVNYTMSLLSRAGLGYHHDFVNSPFVGAYYDMDAIYGVYQQLVASRLVTYLYGRFENRRFGPAQVPGGTAGESVNRVDNYALGGVAVDYIIAKVIMLGASYSLTLNRTLSGADAGAINYTKHVLLFRLGAVY